MGNTNPLSSLISKELLLPKNLVYFQTYTTSPGQLFSAAIICWLLDHPNWLLTEWSGNKLTGCELLSISVFILFCSWGGGVRACAGAWTRMHARAYSFPWNLWLSTSTSSYPAHFAQTLQLLLISQFVTPWIDSGSPRWKKNSIFLTIWILVSLWIWNLPWWSHAQ